MEDNDARSRPSTGRWSDWIVPGDPRKVGRDPDYRFSLANERTFLAWIRTSLALTAGGLGTVKLLRPFPGRELLGVMLLLLALAVSATSYRRWARNEEAIRTDRPLPPSRLPMLLAVGAGVVGLVAVVIVVLFPQ